MRARRLSLVTVAVVGCAVSAVVVPAQPAAAVLPPGPGPAGASGALDLDRRISGLLPSRLTNPRLGKDVAIQVRGVDGAQVLFSSQATEAQMPASNMKLVTALGALTSLGPETLFPTRVSLRAGGPGIVLVGGGDPLLSSADLDTLAARTATALAVQGGGVAPTSVRLYLDDSLFSDRTLAPGWRSTYIRSEVTYVRALGRHGVLATDSAKDAATYFAGRLKARGIAVSYRGRGAGAGGAEVARLDGHSVAAAVSRMLTVSDNQVAETLFRQVALAHGKPATWAGGSAAAAEVLGGFGIRTVGVALRDGSGLSRSDRLSATAVTDLLAVVRSGVTPSLEGFVDWLPVAGRSGTLAASNGRYTTSPSRCAVGLVHAKTGTLTGAVALSGVAVGRDGNSRVFSIIVNHPPTSRYSVLTVRRAMDGLAATLTGCW